MPPLSDDDVRWLLRLLEEEGLAEIEVVQGEDRVLVRARANTPVHAAPVATVMPPPAHPPAQVQAPEAPEPTGTPVTAPMAGIFYRAPSPESDPFVEVGDRIEAGQVVGLIEAMKLFNEIPSPVAGMVTKVLADNEQRVEPDQPLLYVQQVLKQE